MSLVQCLAFTCQLVAYAATYAVEGGKACNEAENVQQDGQKCLTHMSCDARALRL